jgi:hypothetical protein
LEMRLKSQIFALGGNANAVLFTLPASLPA